MATLLHGESRRMYSWWWDSHISPKNSKWLQENLTDMDRNVKAMIKLIEEDADSFARRAEMYYKKRPELMKLVEEFYRAYRALAERYDHATGALRQAHRTMAEAFPNQIPPIMTDESPSSSGTEFGPHTPEIPSPMCAPMDPDDLQKDVLGVSTNFHARGRNGAYSEESNLLSSKKGLKQLNEMFPSGEGLTHAKSEGKVRKVLNFKDEGKTEEKEDLKNEIKRLQGEVSELTTRNENLMTQMASESQHARTVEETISKLEAVKEAALLQYKLSIERVSSLETDICNTRHELNKANDEMVVKLNCIEEQCLAMEKVIKPVQLELENQQKELEKRGRELEELNTSIEVEHQKRMQAEVALMSLEQIHTHSQEEAELLVLEIQRGSEMLKEMELNKVGLEEKISELNEIIGKLHEQNISFGLNIKDLHDEMKLLKETKDELELELGVYMEERKALQDELFCLKDDHRDLEQRNRGLTEQMVIVSEKNVVLENSLSDEYVELEGLRQKANALEASCETLVGEVSTHVVEKGVLISQIEIISQNMERLSEKSTSLENSLSDANAELEGLRARFKDMEECCMSLCDQNSTHLAEKNALVSQVENLENKYLELQNQHLNLEKEKDSKVNQVMELQCFLTLEKQEHEALLLSSSSQLASLHSQIILLEEQLRVKMEDFEMEQEKVMNYLLEMFIFQRCLCEMNDKNLFLFGERQKLLEASRCTENQISQLKHKELIQENELASLSKRNGVLTKGIHRLLEALNIDVKQRTAGAMTEEVVVQIILAEIKNLLNSLSDTRDENRQLYHQVANIETNYLTLQEQLANLEKEKDLAVHQVMDLDSSLRLEKEEHEAVILSWSSQLACLQNQVHLLQEEIQVRDEELELEQQNTIKSHLQNFVLQRCLSEMKDNNLFLFGECQNLLDALRCAEKQISELKHKDLIQIKELTLLSNQSNILRARINLLLEALNLDVKKGTMDDPTDEAVVETISGGIRNLLSSISDARDESQRLHLELLVLVTLFKQIGLDNFQLHHELESRTKELLALAGEKHKLMVMSKQLEDENNILVSQVENLENKYLELQNQHLNLEKEKDSKVHQVMELQCFLTLEKQEHEALLLSSSSQLASLHSQTILLEEQLWVKMEDFEMEQEKVMNYLLEMFIFQRCLCEMNDKNLFLFGECQKLLEASRCAENQISQLKHKELIQENELTSLSKRNGVLTKGIHRLLEALNIDVKQRTAGDMTEEIVVQIILAEIKNLLNSLSDTRDENQQLYHQVANIETNYLTLQEQLANVEKEKDLAVHQVMDLDSSLRLEKEEHEAVILSLSSQLASLQNQVHLLQEEIQVRDEELELEQQNTIKAHLQNFVLQRCLSEMKDNNLFLSGECQNLLDALRCAEKQISELKHKDLVQIEELTLLSNQSNILRARINLLLEALNLDVKKGTIDDPSGEAVVETISGGIRNLLSSISDARDESQRLHLELLVLVTLFKQIGLDNFQLHHELESRTKELLALAGEKHKLMVMSKQLEDENNILVSQMETSRQNLEKLETKYAQLEDKNLNLGTNYAELEDKNLNLETMYAELEDKSLNLEREKDLSLHQLLELENSLELEKQEHHALVSHSNNQIASLATQLDLLQEERQVKEDEFEMEQQKASDALLENFILQRCLYDMTDRNLILSGECQKLLDASIYSDKLISELQHECLIQQKEMKLISEYNEKLRNGILLLLKELDINIDCGTVDGTNDEVMLQTLLDHIKAMLNSISNAHVESQCFRLEISVLGTLLKEIGLEKVHLYYELGSRNEEVLSLQEKMDEAMEKNEQLKSAMQILVEQLSDLHASHQISLTEIHNLHVANQSLSKRFYDLKEKMVAQEEENSDILGEALTLDHLFIFYKALNTERGLKLKLLSDNICFILAVKNHLDEENSAQNERIRELVEETMHLNESAILQEFDLNMARNFCEEFNLQIEASENLLRQKEMELSEAREENTELCRKLESVNKDLDGAIVMQRELKKEINTLSIGIVSKEGEITQILEANRFLHTELDRLNFEVEVLRRREEYVTSELQQGIDEVNKCEGEIQMLLDDIQISTVNAAIFEEKLLELIVACESLQIVSMLQKEMFGEEIALKDACADELKKKLDTLERENGTLKADLNAYSPLLMSLLDGVSCVEELIFSLARLQDKQVIDTSDAHESKKSSHQPSKKDSISAKAGFLDLHKLIAKVEALQKVIIDTRNLIQQERLDSNAKIDAARKEIEELQLKEILLQEKSKEKYGQIMKDIQLDQVSRSRVGSYSTNNNENAESDDQMLELWETAERDDIEAVEEVKSEYPSSELIAEKEPSIDKLEVSTRVNESPPRVWNKGFIEKLDSDAQRLSVLQRSLQELKTKLVSSEKKKHPITSEYGTLKAQLREAEEAILEQIDINGKLKKKVEDNFESSNAVIWEKERRQVSEQARRGSEKIGKLELELQKIEYIFLKFEEEDENMRTGCVDRKSSTLRDYISGKRDGKGKRKGPFCGCMRPKTKA